jgi:hypothetical protein
MARKSLSAPAAPFYYEGTQQTLTPSGSPPTLDIDLGPVDGNKINGIDIVAAFGVTTTANIIGYLRVNNANITGDHFHVRGYYSGGTSVPPETGNLAGFGTTLSGFIIAETDFNHSADLWFRSTVFTRAGSYRHVLSHYGNQDATSLNSMIQGMLSGTWRDSTTLVTRLGLRLQAASGFTSAQLNSLVVRSF